MTNTNFFFDEVSFPIVRYSVITFREMLKTVIKKSSSELNKDRAQFLASTFYLEEIVNRHHNDALKYLNNVDHSENIFQSLFFTRRMIMDYMSTSDDENSILRVLIKVIGELCNKMINRVVKVDLYSSLDNNSLKVIIYNSVK